MACIAGLGAGWIMAYNWGHCTHMCSHVLRMNSSHANTVQPKPPLQVVSGLFRWWQGPGGDMGWLPSALTKILGLLLLLQLDPQTMKGPFQGVSWGFSHQCAFHWRFYCLKVPPSLVLKGYLTSPSQEGWETSGTNNTFFSQALCTHGSECTWPRAEC